MTDQLSDGTESQSVPVNVYQTEDSVVIVAPLPGVMPDDVEVVLDGTDVTIRAAMRSAAPKEYLVHEWHYGPYERTVSVPAGFAGKAHASFGNGQLAVSLGRGEGEGEAEGGGSRVIRPAAHGANG